MLDLHIKLDEDDARRAGELLGRLADRAEDISGALGHIGEGLLNNTHDRFDSQTDPHGKPWAPLALTTIVQRGGGGHILNVSGRLRGSISYQVSGNVLRIGPNAPPYDAAHQFGSTHEIRAKPGKALKVPMIGAGGFGYAFLRAVIVPIPARPYIGFGPKDEETTRDAVEEWLEIEAME